MAKEIKRWRSSKTKRITLETLKKAEDENIPIIVFDVETNGLSAVENRIIQFSALKCHCENMTVVVDDEINRYIKQDAPSCTLPKKIVNLTGITDELLADKPTEAELFPIIADFIPERAIFVGHNSKFDMDFLTYMYVRNMSFFSVVERLDTLAMARDLLVKGKQVENHKLETLSHYFGLTEEGKFHDASYDTACTRIILNNFVQLYLKQEDEFGGSKPRAEISRISWYQKYFTARNHMTRIYVETNHGSLFYDCGDASWKEKDYGIIDIIDMDALENDVFSVLNASNYDEFISRVKELKTWSRSNEATETPPVNRKKDIGSMRVDIARYKGTLTTISEVAEKEPGFLEFIANDWCALSTTEKQQVALITEYLAL